MIGDEARRVRDLRMFWLCIGLVIAACLIALANLPASAPEPGYAPTTTEGAP